MKYIKYTLLIILVMLTIAIIFGISMGARVHYGDNPLALNWDNEGPYIFFKNDRVLDVYYIKRNNDGGYYSKRQDYPIDSLVLATSYYPLDNTSFDVEIKTDFEIPKSIYNDNNKILAISDIESNYKTFRDFLKNNKVIDHNLNWTFGKGHLVLVGDFIDRGYFTTQVLWFIYKLEQEAEKQGGNVHYIIGNHELKMMYGNYGATDHKYRDIASIIGKNEIDLYSKNSLIGTWLASKNAIELINGNLFVHGGIHPDLAESKLTLEEMNQVMRASYYQAFDPESSKIQDKLLISNKTGPSWYRGYFKDGLTQQQVELGLNKFNAKSVIVGHTLQAKVNRLYDDKVIGIDVSHPNDDHKLWPEGKSEGLLIVGDKYYRVFNNGEKQEL
ncbi:metallophosphoesterase [Colwelliaceae bacterium 6441]